MLTQPEIAKILLWGPSILNTLSLRAQILHNRELQSTHGLGIWPIWLMHMTMLSQCLYAILLELPFVIRATSCIDGTCVMILIFQSMLYAPNGLVRARVFVLHGTLFALAPLLFVVGTRYPASVGSVAGWMVVIITSVTQLPGVYLHWRRKSMHGYSIKGLVYGTISPVVVLWGCYQLTLPLPSWVWAVRLLMMRVVQWGVYVCYHVLGSPVSKGPHKG